MSCCDSPDLLPFDDALNILRSEIHGITETETLALGNSLNRILAEDIISQNDIPNYDNSAMDGYALNTELSDTEMPLRVIGESFAGKPFQSKLGADECIRIMTGAKIPGNCNCVVMQENVIREGDSITLTKPARNGDNIRRAGNDVAAGSLVLAAGRRLGPVEIGMLASVGTANVRVRRKIKVAVFSTGDELTPLGHSLEEGQIYDSNRYLLVAALQQLGVAIHDYGALSDDPDLIERAFLRAAKDCDAVISSGGVSVGEADFTRDILLKHGDIEFYKLAVKPGKPFAFGSIYASLQDREKQQGCYFFGLPGNPVSAAVTFHQLAVPALKVLAGEIERKAISFRVPAFSPFKKRPGRVDFQRARLVYSPNGKLCVESTGTQSSGALSSMVAANCYVRLDTDRGNVESGELVDVIPLNDLR